MSSSAMWAKDVDVRVPAPAPANVAPAASLEKSGLRPGNGGGGDRKVHHLDILGVRVVNDEEKRCEEGRREMRMWWKVPCRPARPAQKAVVLILIVLP